VGQYVAKAAMTTKRSRMAIVVICFTTTARADEFRVRGDSLQSPK
jgi:hypothetical protein